MPKSKISKKKLFREFSRLDQRYIKRNGLKELKTVLSDLSEVYGVSKSELMFLLWAYDLEFWTIRHASKGYNLSKRHLSERIIYPLANKEYVYKHFDKLTPSDTYEDHLFRDETKYNYRVRYALTQKARLLVQRFYKSLEG